jgi:enamine deaminase RidA (YjgF/YER057c/UK114 family)
VIAVEPAEGKIIKGFNDLPDGIGATIGQTGEFSVDLKDGPILAQSWYILNSIHETMIDAGGSIDDVFKLVQYFRNLSDFPRYNNVRRMFFPNISPVSTVVEVSAMMPSDEIVIEVEATAYLPEKE